MTWLSVILCLVTVDTDQLWCAAEQRGKNLKCRKYVILKIDLSGNRCNTNTWFCLTYLCLCGMWRSGGGHLNVCRMCMWCVLALCVQFVLAYYSMIWCLLAVHSVVKKVAQYMADVLEDSRDKVQENLLANGGITKCLLIILCGYTVSGD